MRPSFVLLILLSLFIYIRVRASKGSSVLLPLGGRSGGVYRLNFTASVGFQKKVCVLLGSL